MAEKLYYDLHIHSALSPCGDEDMTPNNIANMAGLNGLDVIALTDHNSCGNVAALMSAVKKNGLDLIVVPGMELETSEEVHVVCLFGTLDAALEFEGFVKSRMPFIRNRPEIFGNQQLINDEDEVVGELDGLLLAASSIDLYEAAAKVNSLGGTAVPAHIDRDSYSLLTNLGFVAADLPVGLVEISTRNDPEAFMIRHKRQFMKEVDYLQSSDAHYLGNIAEKTRYIRAGARNAEAVVEALKKKGMRPGGGQ